MESLIATPVHAETLAQRLNTGCRCTSLDRDRLEAALESVSPGFHDEVMTGRPNLFSGSMVFVTSADLARMAELVTAIDVVLAMPVYREHVLAWAPSIARHEPGTPGVFLGYDFHVGETGPQLIEINTNAGGGMLNAVLASAQRACCADVAAVMPDTPAGAGAEPRFLSMFAHEWQCWVQQRWLASTPLPATLAIVDTAPEAQFLYPEFVLFARLFEGAGINVVICDPAALSFRDAALWHGERRIDMVYNRLTDFALEDPSSAALRQAYCADAALITPHPRAHALYAEKRNLVTLTDDQLLESWGVAPAIRDVLRRNIPRTELVTANQGDDFWARRRQLFFKPAAGYGSKAAYRGDKLTRRVFDEILAGDYVAQAMVAPSVRVLSVDHQPTELKLDLRNYVYDGRVQLTAARLWQGQTTNFRTPGGGFAPVVEVPGES
jgi:hypothetical protein